MRCALSATEISSKAVGGLASRGWRQGGIPRVFRDTNEFLIFGETFFCLFVFAVSSRWLSLRCSECALFAAMCSDCLSQ
jgi:hypothetical protein